MIISNIDNRPKHTTSPEREVDEEDLKERNRVYDRLPMYKKNIKFEEEAIKMFFQ